MRFKKILRFDIQNGFLKNRLLLFVPAGLALVSAWNYLRSPGISPLSFRQCIGRLYGRLGGEPRMWPIVFSITLLLLFSYPHRDMEAYGMQVMTRAQSRSVWWLSKTVWMALCTLYVHGTAVGVTALFCAAAHIPFTPDSGPLFQTLFFRLVTAVVLSIGVNLLQLTLSLFFEPVFGVLAVAVLLFGGFFNIMLGPDQSQRHLEVVWFNFRAICDNFFAIVLGVGLTLAVVSTAAGVLRFHHYDLFGAKETE